METVMQGVTKITVTKKYNGRVDKETIPGPISNEEFHKLMVDNLKDKDAVEVNFELSFGEPTTTTLTKKRASNSPYRVQDLAYLVK